MPARDLTRFGWLSIGAALTTMALKLGAWLLTDSVGLLSDALESTVNLAAGILMLVALRVAAQPPDDSHQYGHEKAELFSAAAEGLMIVLAASLVMWTSIDRLLHPIPLDRLGVGAAVSAVATVINLGVGLVLLRAAKQYHSRALAADGHHLLTDVTTSVGVLGGLALVAVTDWAPLDPLLGLAVGINIVIAGARVLWSSVEGLMDPPLPAEELAAIDAVLEDYRLRGVAFHATRSRVSGTRRFYAMHVLVPGAWTVSRGHQLLEQIEGDLRAQVPNLHVFTHLEPVEDPASFLDEHLDRTDVS
ncbi:MAG: cation diffusion facilitator family transporter [Acidimicrobiales bacterium]